LKKQQKIEDENQKLKTELSELKGNSLSFEKLKQENLLYEESIKSLTLRLEKLLTL